MDAKRLLGVAPTADRAAVGDAHRRLVARLDAAPGATAELRRLVDAARRVAAGDATAGAHLSADPAALLGVDRPADPDAVRAAYRRLARLVHPDLGGTDELFRVVEAARDVLLGEAAGAPQRRVPWTSSPPPRRAPRPYRAPPPNERPRAATWRTWRDVAVHGLVVAAFAGVLVAAAAWHPAAFAVVLFAVLLLSGRLLQPAVEGLLRNLAMLRRFGLRVDPDVEPQRFLEETCLDAPVSRQDDTVLYARYLRWCADRRRRPVARWVFAERLHRLGLLHVRASSSDPGLWIGIRLRER